MNLLHLERRGTAHEVKTPGIRKLRWLREEDQGYLFNIYWMPPSMVSARSGCFIFYDMGNRRERESIQITRERGASGRRDTEVCMYIGWVTRIA